VRRRHAPKRFRLRSTDPPEVEFHKTVADLLDWILLPPTVWTTFPAGWGELPISTAARLKACGLKPGFPDILIWRHDGHSMGIELKKPGKKPTAEQHDVHVRLGVIHVPVYVCVDINEVIMALRNFGLPLRKMAIDGVDYGAKGHHSEEARGAAQSTQSAKQATQVKVPCTVIGTPLK